MQPELFQLKRLFYLYFLISSSFYFSACENNHGNDEASKTINEALERSNELMTNDGQNYLYRLKDKLLKIESHEKALVWEPKAESIDSISGYLIDYIKKLQSEFNKDATNDENSVTDFFIKGNNGQQLYKKIISYKTVLFAIDSSLAKEILDTAQLINRKYDVGDLAENFAETFFTNISKQQANVLLNSFINNTLTTKLKLLNICNSKTVVFEPEFFYAPLTMINRGYVKGGDRIEITTGIGHFLQMPNTEITINGVNVPVSDLATAKYSFKASSIPGNHLIPVTVKFLNPNTLKSQVCSFKIEYTVAGESPN